MLLLLVDSRNMAKDYYNILGVSKDATQDEIKKAFRRLAHEYHPDKGTGDEAKFKEINEAYQVLSNAEKRQQYDQFGSSFDQAGAGGPGGFGGFDFSQGFSGFGGNGANFSDFSDIFSEMFGGGGRRTRRNTRGSDIEVNIEVNLEDVIHDMPRKLEIYKNARCRHCKGNGAEPGTPIKTCETCNGSGQVLMQQRTLLGVIQTQAACPKCEGEGKIPQSRCNICKGAGREKQTESIEVTIPRGIGDDQTVRVPGKGEAGPHGGAEGDLYVNVRVKSPRNMRRQGYDIFTQLPLTFSEAALGCEKSVETLWGTVTLTVPEGTQSGTELRLKERGVPHLKSENRIGDHLVEVVVVTPKKLSRNAKKLLEQLRREEHEAKIPHEGFFERIRKNI